MKVNLFTLGNSTDKYLVSFFMSIKKVDFVFKNFSFLNNFKNENNLILVSHKIKKSELTASMKKLKIDNLSNSCFLIPMIFGKEIKYDKILSINYPIKIDMFEDQLINFFSKNEYSYKNFSLKNNNFLINTLNNNKVYLTEIESKIIKLLFTNNQVLKKTINSDVLSQQSNVESKSLESHIYRLRKKILNLGEGQIIADGDKSIKFQ